MKLTEFDFILPKDLIANHPVSPRDSSRMMVLTQHGIEDCNFKDLLEYINPQDILIFNDTRVLSASLQGKIGIRNFYILLHKKITNKIWKAFAKKSKKIKIDDQVIFAEDMTAKVLANKDGEITLEFSSEDVENLIEKYGSIPLPIYIKREAENRDKADYQTVYAKNLGSVAAPTAGLHFTSEFFASLNARGIKYDFVTLHIGAGTFLPVKVENINDHKMHSEYCELSKQTADLINKTKIQGGRVIVIGTTALRLLEFVVEKFGDLREFKGESDIFITPGFKFKIADLLFTNFHLPKSTLYMLVSAFSGMENIRKAYQHAIANKYRFFSYGDCCLLYRAS